MLQIGMPRLSLKILITLFLLIFSGSIGLSAENYLCISQLSTGFKYKNDAWETVNFNEGKYIVSVETMTVSHFGGDVFMGDCKFYGLMLACNDGANSFYITTDRLRYQRVSTAGGSYLFDIKTGTPFIEIGTCSKF